jgi:glyoxylase-like metal-dependent hydrolase (beta-lactamase superfamily II)
MTARFLLLSTSALLASAVNADTTEFCLDGEFNLGARYQGSQPGVDEFVPTRWCVVTDDDSERARFFGSGKSNPDMNSSWTVAALPPDLVRIVNAEDPPDIEFRGADARNEARLVRRLDPRRFVEEHSTAPVDGVRAEIEAGQLRSLVMSTDLPLRGRVPITWRWDWSDDAHPGLTIEVDGAVFFRATGSWRKIEGKDVDALWIATAGADPVQVPGENWPSRVNMSRIDIADSVYLVRGVRTGFQHLVVATSDGLVVADAPAGWVELHQVPPTDLVPGLGISGLSEQFIDFLGQEFPGRPVHAVALTHAHDDHSGGARAFAAAGARVYAPAESTEFLERALNSTSMPGDRFSALDRKLDVIPVTDKLLLGNEPNRVQLVSIGASPHGSAALGVHAVDSAYFFVSDLHVPNSEDGTPRADRLATECWFADWAVGNLPSDTIVLNTHSTVETPVSRLVKYLESEGCAELSN